MQTCAYPIVMRPDPVACRSPAVVIAYLMKLRQWRLSESYKWVKDKRPAISLSAGALC